MRKAISAIFFGSRSYVGDVTEHDIDTARDRTDACPMREALQAAGLYGRRRKDRRARPLTGYLEAHIEQGRTLEGSHLGIGVVTSIVGIWQYQITFTGEQNHAGTTPMKWIAEMVLRLAGLCVAIDGRFHQPAAREPFDHRLHHADPGAPSIIPGRAEVLFQVRDDNPAIVEGLEALLREIATEIAAASGCSVQVDASAPASPAMMDQNFQRAIEEAASDVAADGKSVRLPSGAGHDAQVLATIMPAWACCSYRRSTASATTGTRIPTMDIVRAEVGRDLPTVALELNCSRASRKPAHQQSYFPCQRGGRFSAKAFGPSI